MRQFDALFSYDDQDKEFVLQLAQKLKTLGIKIRQKDLELPSGESDIALLQHRVKEHACIVSFIGGVGLDYWQQTTTMSQTFDCILESQTPVIPVLLPTAKDGEQHKRIFSVQQSIVDFRSGLQDTIALNALAQAIKTCSSGASCHTSEGETPKVIVQGNFSGIMVFGNDNRVNNASSAHNHDRIEIRGELLPFVNREDVLKFIFADQSPAYHMIEAPAGFGKTTLLNRLKSFYEKDGWLCALAPIYGTRGANDLLSTIASQLNLNVNERPSGREIALALLQQRGQEFSSVGKKGVVIFVDIEKAWNGIPRFVQKIFQEHIPSIVEVLREQDFCKQQYNPLRVVIAGHYLMGDGISLGTINPVKHQLHPFAHHHIRETAKNFLPQNLPRIDQLVAHLMYYTAGHPGCISKTLALYKSENYPDPDQFFENFRSQIFSEIVYPEISILRQEFEPEMRRVFDELSIFRFIDIGILRNFLTNSRHPSFESEYDLDGRLRSTYLMSPWAEGLFLRDGVTRDLIALRFLSDNGARLFAHACQNAQALCQQKLENPTTQLPDKWLVEYFYQALQQTVEQIDDAANRKQLLANFLEQTLPAGFDIFAKCREARVYRWALKKTLDDDWQFEFMANYFLRGDDYVEKTPNSPFDLIRAKLLALADAAR